MCKLLQPVLVNRCSILSPFFALLLLLFSATAQSAGPAIEIIKTALPETLSEPGGPVTYRFVIHNRTVINTVTFSTHATSTTSTPLLPGEISVYELDDSIYGDLNGQGNCVLPQVLPLNGSYTCEIQVDVQGTSGEVIRNVVTAYGVDFIGTVVSDDDFADVTITPQNQPCDVFVDKSCAVVTPPALADFSCDGKIDSLTMRWPSSELGELLGVQAFLGDSTSDPELPVTISGDEVTVSGYQASDAPNDVMWSFVYANGSGQSVFHLSCSDDEMDGETDDQNYPNDCGRAEGDAKDNSSGDNVWLLEGLVTESGNVLDCTVAPSQGELLSGEPGVDTGSTSGRCTTTLSTGNPADFDAFIESKKPTKNFGTEDELKVKEKPGDMKRTLIRYDMDQCDPQIPSGADVTSASLEFYFRSAKTTTTSLFPITKPWSESGVTWNSTDGSTPWTNAGADYDPVSIGSIITSNSDQDNLYRTLPLNSNGLSVVEGWLAGSPNHGIVLINSNDQEIKLRSEDKDFPPRLLVEYSLDTGAVTTNTLNASPSVVGSGEPLSVTMTLESSVDISGISVTLAAVALDGDVSASCQLISSETLVLAGASAMMTWSCLTDGNGSLRFTGDASGQLSDGSLYDFVRAVSNSVLIGGIGPDTCTIQAPSESTCEQRPTELKFRFEPRVCADSQNSQPDDKWSCAGDVSDAVDVLVTKEGSPDDVYFSGQVSPGGLIVLDPSSVGRDDIDSSLTFTMTDTAGQMQVVTLHTSCSQILGLGDTFGSLEVYSFTNPEQGTVRKGAEVVYHYYVRNNASVDAENVLVMDNILGEVDGSPIARLGPGEEAFLEMTSLVEEGVTNTVQVKVNNADSSCDAWANATVIVEEPVAPFGDCSKPIDELSMIWEGDVEDIQVIAWKGDVGSELLDTISGVKRGDVVTISGYAGSQNDVYWEILAQDGTALGESTFHLSCSDDDMDGEPTNDAQEQIPPYTNDCGKWQGNGKNNGADLINTWILEGLVDSDGELDCGLVDSNPPDTNP